MTTPAPAKGPFRSRSKVLATPLKPPPACNDQPSQSTAPSTGWPLQQIEPFLNYLLTECGLAHNTILAYRRDLARFAQFCLDQRLTSPEHITPVILQAYARRLYLEQLASATIARHLVALRMFFRYHVLTGLTLRDVCAVLETPKTWQRIPGVLNRQRTNQLLDSIDPQHPMAPRDRALLELLYATGMRASEVAELKIPDINFQVGYLRCIGKGRRERIVPVHNLALDTLRQYLDTLRPQLARNPDTGHLFLSRTGRPLSRVDVWRIVRHAAHAAGITGRLTPHTLRHCFGSHLLQGGADLRTVQEILGHADVTTTQIYTHVDHDHLRSVHRKYHPRP